MPPTVREHIRTNPPGFIAAIGHADPSPEGFSLARHEAGFGVRCVCGAGGFRVLGVPEAMVGGRRGFVLRSVLRIWRELRLGAAGGMSGAGRLAPPIVLGCTRCGAHARLAEAAVAAEGDGRKDERREGDATVPPLEALRCRPCRRSTFDVAVLCAYHDADLDADARGGEEERYDGWRLAVRCRACGMPGEAFELGLRSEQQRNIDRLYGRDAMERARPTGARSPLMPG